MKNFFTLLILLSSLMYAGVKGGDTAPDFKAAALFNKNKTVSLKDFKGEVIILHFWASWCKACKKEFPHLAKIDKKFPKGTKMMAVSLDSKLDNAQEFIKALNLDIPFGLYFDSEKELGKAYRPKGMPTTYVIGKNGKITHLFPASFSEESIHQLLSAVNEAHKQ